MRHATPAALEKLEGVLKEIRKHEELQEKRRGVFYHKGRAFLHFHEDPAGLFADARLTDDDFQRFAVNTAVERNALMKRIGAFLNSNRSVTDQQHGRSATHPGRTRPAGSVRRSR